MKKTYISPAIVAVNLNASGLMAVSLGVNNGSDPVDTSNPGTQLGRENNGWSNGSDVWSQGW